jgi:hypothetical protein
MYAIPPPFDAAALPAVTGVAVHRRKALQA